MAYEDPNAPSRPHTPAQAEPSSTAAVTNEKKARSWDWMWPSIIAFIIFKVFGLVGGLVAFGCYYWLKPKLGTLGAVAASAVIGVLVAIGLMAMIRS